MSKPLVTYNYLQAWDFTNQQWVRVQVPAFSVFTDSGGNKVGSPSISLILSNGAGIGSTNPLPVSQAVATPVNGNGTATAGTATATLTGAANVFTWLTALIITIIDTATAGSAELSLSGVQNGPLVFEVNAQGTANVNAPIVIQFPTPVRSSAVNTNIVATLPTLGAGTGKVSVVVTGYLL